MTVDLRPVSIDDIGLLFQWVNDPSVRANSFQQQDVTWEEHQHWFKQKILSPTARLFIVYHNDLPVGQLRLDIENNSAYISYLVDSLHRGQGIGTQILLIAQRNLPSNINKLIGRVKLNNVASIKAFTKTGFLPELHDEYIEFVYNIEN